MSQGHLSRPKRSGVELINHWVNGEILAREIVQEVLSKIDSIDSRGPTLRSVLWSNSAAVDEATAADKIPIERRLKASIQGMPVLVKDNIDTIDMPTTAGSYALSTSPVRYDADLVRRLRQSGAIIVGKANLSEWGNFRARRSTRAWSARGGLVRNPYALDRTAGGSSSGSAAAVAAGIVPFAIGTETDASIIEPAAFNGIVGLKPTVGLVSQRGIVPISSTMDTAGPMAASVTDTAILLDAISQDSARPNLRRHGSTTFQAMCTDSSWKDMRVGILSRDYWAHMPEMESPMRNVMACLESEHILGATDIVLPELDRLGAGLYQFTVLLSDFRNDLPQYLASRGVEGPQTLEDIVEFNREHADVEMEYFGQDLFEMALTATDKEDATYREALTMCRVLGGEKGIDAALESSGVDCLIYPAMGPAWKADLIRGETLRAGSVADPLTAVSTAGYPIMTIPAGQIGGLPVGIVLIGPAWSEHTLIAAAYGLEQRLSVKLSPEFREPVVG